VCGRAPEHHIKHGVTDVPYLCSLMLLAAATAVKLSLSRLRNLDKGAFLVVKRAHDACRRVLVDLASTLSPPTGITGSIWSASGARVGMFWW
jgi:hypothetical protein